MIKEFLSGLREKRSQLKEMQTQDRLNTMVEERKKSANERELERFMEEERQKMITHKLGEFRNQRKEEERKQSILGGKNIFKGHTSILTDNKKLFSNSTKKGGHQFFK